MVQTAYVRISVRDAEKAIADLKRIDSTAAAGFERMVKTAQAATRATRALGAAQQEASAAAQGLAARLGPVGAALSRLGPIGLAAAAGFSLVSATIGAAVRAYAAFEQQTFRLQATLKATGNTAGLTIRQIEELAQRLGRETLASTQGVRDAANVLLTFRSVSGDTFTRTIELAQDLAAVLGGNLRSTVLQLGKALEDPVQGVSALREAGVSFTVQQNEMIKALVDTGRTAEAQRLILDELAKQVGGAGAGEAGGLAGAADTAAESWNLLLEEIGSTQAFKDAAFFLDRVAAAIPAALRADSPDDEVADADERVAAAQAELQAANQYLLVARETFLKMDDAVAERLVAAAQAELQAANQDMLAARERYRVAGEEREKEEAAARQAAADAAAEREKERAAAADKERSDKAREASAKARAEIEAKAAKADLERLERTTETFADYDAAVAAQVRREAEARKKAAEDAAAARVTAEETAQKVIDREREKALREAIRNQENLSDDLVDAGEGLIRTLIEGTESVGDSLRQAIVSALTAAAAEQLFRAPANAFAQGLFGTGGATGGANAGGIAGLAGSIGQSLATSAISDAIGLPSIGSILGFGGGGGAAAGASAGLFGGGGLLGLGAIGGPLALGGLALGGASLLGGLFQKKSVGPNAGARLVLENNRFAIGPTGSDNNGRQFLNQAKDEAQAAADVLNRIITRLGLTVDDVPSEVDLGTAFGASFNRTGRNVAEDVIRSGALGDLTDEQIAAALGGESLFTAQVEAVRQALRSAGIDEAMREAARIVEQAAREQEAADRQVLADQLDAARSQLDAQQDLVDALDDAARTFADAAATLSAGVDAILLSDASPLSPAARLAEAQRQFDAPVAAGDAAGAVAAANALARENASFFGTATTAGASGFTAITSTLRALEADASARASAEREALSAAEQQVAGLESAVATAEAQLAAFGEQNRITAEQLAAAQHQVDLLGQQQAALDAIEAALGEETPDAAVLRQQLDVLEQIGVGQGAVAIAVRDLATAISATSGGAGGASVTAIKTASAASTGVDRFAQVAAEVQQSRDLNFDLGFGGGQANFADGGVVTRPTLALIGEAGQDEAIIPLKGGAVPVRFEGGRGNDDMRASLTALVEVGTETVAELRRLNGRVASLETERRHSGRERLVGSR